MCIKPCHTAPLITNVKNVTNAIPTFFCFVDVRLKVLLMSFHGRYNTTIQTGTYPSDIVDSFFHSAGIPNTNCSRHSYHLHFKRNNWHILFMCDSSSFLEEKKKVLQVVITRQDRESISAEVKTGFNNVYVSANRKT